MFLLVWWLYFSVSLLPGFMFISQVLLPLFIISLLVFIFIVLLIFIFSVFIVNLFVLISRLLSKVITLLLINKSPLPLIAAMLLIDFICFV